MKKKHSGFTLVELLAVIVILALIMIIAIPAVVSTMNSARKESFYLYAQKLQSAAISKYTQDMNAGELGKDKNQCTVYNISTDLDLANTDNYQGWVMVKRVPKATGKKIATRTITSDQDLQYVKYCITDENVAKCTPDSSYAVADGLTSATVTQTVDTNQSLCVSYQKVTGGTGANHVGGQMVTVDAGCTSYADAFDSDDSFSYSVSMSLRDNSYGVQDVSFSDKIDMDSFYDALKTYSETEEAKTLKIVSPVCNESDVPEVIENEDSKTTENKTTVTTTRKVAGDNTTTTTTKQDIENTTTRTTAVGEAQNSTTTTTARGEIVATTTVTTQKETSTYQETTTIDISDATLLLSDISVGGYDIGFSKYDFYYDLVVPNSVESLNVNAVPVDNASSIVITGADVLNVGTNQVIVQVTGTNGVTSQYKIQVSRLNTVGEVVEQETTQVITKPSVGEDGLPDPTIEESNASLAFISVSNYDLGFDSNVYDYTLVTKGDKQLFLNYESVSKNALVSVSGNENLSDGDQIVIYVQSQNGYYHKTYTITVKTQTVTSTGTKVLRGVVIGLAVALLILLVIVGINKNKKVKTSTGNKDDIASN